MRGHAMLARATWWPVAFLAAAVAAGCGVTPTSTSLPGGSVVTHDPRVSSEVVAAGLVSEYGTRLTQFESEEGDDVCVTIALPFSFPLYESAYTSVGITDNGYLVFNPVLDISVADNSEAYVTPELDLAVNYLWNNDETSPKVAPMWYDFYLGSPRATGHDNGGSVWADTSVELNGRSAAVFTWDSVEGLVEVADFSDLFNEELVTSTATFQVVLYETGQVELNYGAIDLMVNPNHSFMTAVVGVSDGLERITQVDNSEWGDLFGLGESGPQDLSNSTLYLGWVGGDYEWQAQFPEDRP